MENNREKQLMTVIWTALVSMLMVDIIYLVPTIVNPKYYGISFGNIPRAFTLCPMVVLVFLCALKVKPIAINIMLYCVQGLVLLYLLLYYPLTYVKFFLNTSQIVPNLIGLGVAVLIRWALKKASLLVNIIVANVIGIVASTIIGILCDDPKNISMVFAAFYPLQPVFLFIPFAVYRDEKVRTPQPRPEPVNLRKPGSSDTVRSLEGVAQLHAEGILTDEEFARKKTEIIGKSTYVNSKVAEPKKQDEPMMPMDGNTVRMLENYGRLHKDGLLTDEEFAAKKRDLINKKRR